MKEQMLGLKDILRDTLAHSDYLQKNRYQNKQTRTGLIRFPTNNMDYRSWDSKEAKHKETICSVRNMERVPAWTRQYMIQEYKDLEWDMLIESFFFKF